jgi:hypothetical protein
MNTAPRSHKKRRPRNLKKLTEDNVRKLPVKRRPYYAWDAGTDAARGLFAACSILKAAASRIRCTSAASAR